MKPIEERTVRSIINVCLALGLLAACGAGATPVGPITTGEPPDTTSAATAPPLTTATTAAPSTTATGAGSTIPAETTTTATPPATTAPASETTSLTVFFLSDQGGNAARHGPFLIPVRRTVPKTQQVARAAIEQLLGGTSADETAAGISTTVPETTLLLGVNIENGVATVDLTRDFESGGGSASMTGRLAQLVYTVTQFPTVEAVELRLDGAPVEVFSGEGIVIDGPLTRDDYLDVVPQIMPEIPGWGGELGNPARLAGVAAVFEAVFQVELTATEGEPLPTPPFVMTSNGVGWGTFDVTFEYDVDSPRPGTLKVWQPSPEDGSEQGVSVYPVLLMPAG